MEPRIEKIAEKKLIGYSITMSISNNKTQELWQSFMPRKKEITNMLHSDLFSMQIYDPSLDFKDFNPKTIFEKWAAVEVPDYIIIPSGMKTHILKGGLYAVFTYIGRASEFQETFRYIYGTWIPNSEYKVDNREHFELLGAKYKNNEPDSEEEIWVPIRKK